MRFALNAVQIAVMSLVLAGTTVAEANSKRDVRIAGAIYAGDLPTYVADERGFFAGHGLEATVQYSDSGKRSMALLRSGDVDFALMALTPFVLDRAADPDPGQPDDPVILASLLQSHELTAVMVSHASGIESPADLAGRRVRVGRGSSSEFVLWLFEQFHGIDGTSVERVSIAFPDLPDAFTSGRVDAAVLVEPWASRLDAQANRFDISGLYAGRWILVTTRRHVLEHPDLNRNMVKAYRQAIEFIERAPDDAISIYIQSIETADSPFDLRWEALDFDICLDWALVASLREQFLWARDTGTDNTDNPIHVLGLIEPGPLNDVWPAAVRIPVAARRETTP